MDGWLADYFEEWRDYGHAVIRAKWTMDGATTLAEAAARFRGRADELDELARAGFELMEPVNDDYAFVIRPGEESPMRLGEELQ
jgi:hypothetical protein